MINLKGNTNFETFYNENHYEKCDIELAIEEYLLNIENYEEISEYFDIIDAITKAEDEIMSGREFEDDGVILYREIRYHNDIFVCTILIYFDITYSGVGGTGCNDPDFDSDSIVPRRCAVDEIIITEVIKKQPQLKLNLGYTDESNIDVCIEDDIIIEDIIADLPRNYTKVDKIMLACGRFIPTK